MGLVFIPEDILGNMETVKSLCLVPKVSSRVQSQYLQMSSLSLQKLSRLIKGIVLEGDLPPAS